jgi:ABC-type multidrug transport system fused ATPase/permease subunit
MTIAKKIWMLLIPRQRFVAVFLMGAILLNSILETFSIGLILPLVKLITNPDAVQNYSMIVRFAGFFGLTDNREILVYIFYFFIAIYICKTIYFMGLTYFQQRFVANIMHNLSSRLFNIYLCSPWTFHLSKNSAELQNNIINQAGSLCTGLISSVLNLSTESLVAGTIVILLLFIDPTATFLAIIIIGAVSIIFFYFVRGKLESYGTIAQEFSAKMIKTVNEAFGGIKETKVLGREYYFVKTYGKNNLEYVKSWIYPALIHQIQRSTIEILFIGGIIAISLYILLSGKETSYLISILALLAAAAFRLMPSVNRMNQAIIIIKYYKPILDTVYGDVNIPIDKIKVSHDSGQVIPRTPTLQKSIELVNVSFRYPGSNQNILDSVSISIPRGCSIGFIGPSGAGKTTIVDIILGLLKPDSGKVLVDGCNIHENLDLWQQHIGYIPQNIYLSDNTICRNIAFGLDDTEIDEDKVWAAIKNAQLEEVVMALPEGLDTRIGEHGLRMSGGQRQRIGIARALYNDPEVLVMDEATSSLDTETEKELSNAIDRLSGQKTLLIIAHRMTTVEKCDIRFYIRNGKIENILMREKKEVG